MTTNNQTIQVPFALYEQYVSNVCCSQLCEYFMGKKKKPFLADRYAFAHEGKLYLPTGCWHGTLETSKVCCHELVPMALWSGETSIAPFHASGAGYYHGVVVMYHGEECVISGEVDFTTLLPESASKVTMAEAKDFELKHAGRRGYWRSQSHIQQWIERDGKIVAAWNNDRDSNDPIYELYYREPKGKLVTMGIKSLSSLSEYQDLNYIPALSDIDQISLF